MKESFIQYAKELFSQTEELGLVETYKRLFNEEVSYDTARKQLRGIKLFLDCVNSDKETTNNIEEDIITKKDITLNKDNTQTSSQILRMTDEQTRDKDFLLKAHKYNPEDFELIMAKNSIWENGNKTLYSSKITVKPKDKKQNTLKQAIDDLKEYFSNKTIPYNYTPKQYLQDGDCFVPCLFDVHFNKYCSFDETGNEYNYQKAADRFLSVIKEYIDRLQNKKLEKIIFPIGNDFFNSEVTGGTTANTPQDNDLRYPKCFSEGIKCLIQAIELLATLAPIDVILIQGNHSESVEYFAACVLRAYFKDSKLITIDSSPYPRKYRQFGKVLIGFAHGEKEKEKIYSLMQCEVPDLWGKTKIREFLLGHWHHEESISKNGIVVRTMPSVTDYDVYHVQNGYNMTEKRSMGIIYNKEKGLTDILYVDI